jgi:hypothetical protein
VVVNRAVTHISGAELFRDSDGGVDGVDMEFSHGVLVMLRDGLGVADGTLVMLTDVLVTGVVELKNMPDELVVFNEGIGVDDGMLVTLAEVNVAGAVELREAIILLIDAMVNALDNADE